MTANTPKYPRYQDYVVRDGRLIGQFEEMYRDHEDPWDQSVRGRFASDKAVGVNLLRHARHLWGGRRVLEIGCGFGEYTEQIAAADFEAIGIDISETAVLKAGKLRPHIQFEAGGLDAREMIAGMKPDAIIMADVTWYVLEQLKDFLNFLRAEIPDALIFHTLSFYNAGEQRYGCEYFTDPEGAEAFFGMCYLETGAVRLPDGRRRAWFLGSWRADRLADWAASVGVALPAPAP